MAQARAARVARVVSDVCAAAVGESGAAGIALLEPASPEGRLLAAWLEAAAGEWTLWQGDAATDAADALVAHPASKTVLLLGGRLPRADLLPLGDLWASEVAELAGDWSGPGALPELAARAGGIAALDAALRRLVEERVPAPAALAGLPRDAAAEVLHHYDRGRYWRLRPRLTPKLTARTLGIDLFD